MNPEAKQDAEAPFEPVHTVHDFYDGPRGGVADYRGVPHVYSSLWLDVAQKGEDDFPEDVFVLKKMEPSLFQLVVEDWQIFLRWRRAFDRGEVDLSTHPALPKDRVRHDEIHVAAEAALEVAADDPEALRATAQFDFPQGEWAPRVRWSPVGSGG